MVAQPRFFIVRPDTKHTAADGRAYTVPGPIVPLVAVDELPEWLDIPSAPRELSVEQTVGLCNVGVANKSKGAYAVKIIHHATPAARQKCAAVKHTEAKPSTAATADAAAEPSSPASASTHHESKGTITPAAMPAADPTDGMKSHRGETHSGTSTGAITTSEHSPQQPHPPQMQPAPSAMTNISTTPANNNTTTNTTNTPNSASTDYCRHWCHYGTCKWGLRCRYLHAMPATAAELATVGLGEIPAWWVATAAGAVVGPASGAHPHPHQHPHQHQQLQHPHPHPHPQQQQHAQQPRHTNPSSPPPDTTTGGSSNTLDPRDVRLGVVRRLGLLPHGHGHAEGITSGGGSTASNKAMRAQLHGLVALLRELGLGGGGGCGYARPRRRETNPLQRMRGKGVVGKGVVLRGPEVDAAAVVASATAGAGGGGGQMQSGLAAVPGPVRDDVVEGGRAAGGTVQPIAEKVERLVDV
ncbi:hypothetical protein B0I37DRAFT_440612 [Chaetomium sp. MPI-CAGE-AT-0009]|nr:hypothetical protein B0I37DRAFT_440612 [Chaetomium sp. MPI-CAGE-AT-0009]